MTTMNARAPVEVPKAWGVVDRAGIGPFVTREVYRLEDGTHREWSSRSHRKHHERAHSGSLWWQPRAIGWWIALLFAIGSLLFTIGVVPAYATAVGGPGDAVTFFAGSIFFTSAGYLQFMRAISAPTDAAGDVYRPRRWIAWQPGRIDWWACGIQSIGHGSRCATDGGAVRTGSLSWWIVAMNLGGSIAFLSSAFAAFINPDTGKIANVPVANLGTFLGAVGFFIGALLLIPEMGSDAPS